MGEWTLVRRCFEHSVALQRESFERLRRAEEARHALAAWYSDADELVRDQLSRLLTERIAELGQLGADVSICSSRGRRHVVAAEPTWCLELAYAGQSVWAYSARSEAQLCVYWAWLLRRPGARFPRILSVPAFRVLPGPARQVLLEPLVPGHGGQSQLGEARAGLQLQNAVCELLGMLVGAATRGRCSAAGALTCGVTAPQGCR